MELSLQTTDAKKQYPIADYASKMYFAGKGNNFSKVSFGIGRRSALFTDAPVLQGTPSVESPYLRTAGDFSVSHP
jgi:hypothetical protein